MKVGLIYGKINALSRPNLNHHPEFTLIGIRGGVMWMTRGVSEILISGSPQNTLREIGQCNFRDLKSHISIF